MTAKPSVVFSYIRAIVAIEAPRPTFSNRRLVFSSAVSTVKTLEKERRLVELAFDCQLSIKRISLVFMDDSSNFKLDRVPPELKAIRKQTNLKQRAAAMRTYRQKLKAQGYVETLMFLPRPIHEHIIQFQKEHKLLTRGHAVAVMLEQVISGSNGRKRRE